MEFGWPPELEGFRDEVRAFVARHRSPELLREIAVAEREGSVGPLMSAVIDAVEQRGWTQLSIPRELGGDGRPLWYRFIFALEFYSAGLRFTRDTYAGMIAPAIQRFGSAEQKRTLLPQILSGAVTCALGYSEPNAGSDLASLQTRAVRDSDDYVINGQKMWTTAAHRASHIWLAARTDPEAPKHRGISIFLVPVRSPGLTVRPVWVLSGRRTNEVFLDDVRVPASALIGEENRGWYVMTSALDHERVTVGVMGYAEVAVLFDQYLTYLQNEAPALLTEASARRVLAELERDMDVLRALLLRCTDLVARGQSASAQASMLKVWSSELRNRMSGTMMDLLGACGAQAATAGAPAPLGGRLEDAYRHSILGKFTAGSNEVQRDIIAQRGLGLPR
jgi:alkylation response protein AidB-like acyl-CoA dehydrogenase